LSLQITSGTPFEFSHSFTKKTNLLRVLKETLYGLPEGVEKVSVRSDGAGYENHETGVIGVEMGKRVGKQRENTKRTARRGAVKRSEG